MRNLKSCVLQISTIFAYKCVKNDVITFIILILITYLTSIEATFIIGRIYK